MPATEATLVVEPKLEHLPRLVAFVETFAEEHGFSMADTFSVTLAVEELFANTVEHGQPHAHSAELSLQVEEDVATVTYSDDGGPFDPTHQAAPDTTLSADARPIGGLGLHIIRKSMQGLRYERLAGRNCITFSRSLTR